MDKCLSIAYFSTKAIGWAIETKYERKRTKRRAVVWSKKVSNEKVSKEKTSKRKILKGKMSKISTNKTYFIFDITLTLQHRSYTNHR
jgi:phosphoenolpyruvate synthase/pyruvate phosphate dikinase